MPDSIPINPSPQKATVDSNGSRLPSLDFRGQHVLEWSEIETELHSISMRAMSVEMIGRTAQDAVHGDDLTDVFGLLAEDMSDAIERLRKLLGLGREARS